MDEVQEAAQVEAALDALGDDATAEQILQAIRGYGDAGVQIALRRLSGSGGEPFNGGTITDPLVIDNDANGDIPLVIEAASGQTADILDVIDRGGRYRLYILPQSEIALLANRDVPQANDWLHFRGGFNEIMFGMNGYGYAYFTPSSDIASDEPAFEILTSAGSATLRARNNKTITFHKNAAPADSDISNSSFALWLDATPGATKLMVKAKDSGGTVRTTAINLT